MWWTVFCIDGDTIEKWRIFLEFEAAFSYTDSGRHSQSIKCKISAPHDPHHISGSLPPHWASKHLRFMIQTTQCYSFVKLCIITVFTCVTYALIKYIYSRLSIYLLISRSLISVKVISRSLFFEKYFLVSRSHTPPPPPLTPPPPLYTPLCMPYQTPIPHKIVK